MEATGRKSLKLQFGHGVVAVETLGFHCRTGKTAKRFNSATALLPWRRGLNPLREHGLISLQFGHGVVAVETWLTPVLEPIPLTPLQFGHGVVAVETGSL